MIALASDHLRCSVAWTTACGFEHFTILIHVRQAEVNYLDIVLIIKKQVLRLQVTMTDAYFMNVFDTGYDLLGEAAGLLFGQPFLFYNVVEQFATAGILHDQKQLSRSFDDL